VHPSAHSSPQSKWQMDRFSRFCTAYCRKCLYFTMGAPIHQNYPLPMGDLNLSCNMWYFRPMRAHNPNSTSIGSAVFAQMTAECLFSLQWFACFPLKIALPMLASGPHVICGSLGPPDSGMQMATWSSQPFLQGSLVWHTDRATERPTDRPSYSVWSGIIMRNYVGYGKATQSFHASTNNFATIKSPSVRSKHLIKYLV